MPTPGYDYQTWMLAEVDGDPKRRSRITDQRRSYDRRAGPRSRRYIRLVGRPTDPRPRLLRRARGRVHGAHRLERRRQDHAAAHHPRVCSAPDAGRVLVAGARCRRAAARSATCPKRSSSIPTSRCARATSSRSDSTPIATASRAVAPRQRELVEQILHDVDAERFADNRLGSLSGGEQQRVFIAHALVSQPELLLLDEPLANLDPKSVQEIVSLLHRVARELRRGDLALGARDERAVAGHGPHRVPDRAVAPRAGRPTRSMRSDVLSRLYGHHVDVLQLHGRVLVVAEPGQEQEIPLSTRRSRSIDRRALHLRTGLLHQRAGAYGADHRCRHGASSRRSSGVFVVVRSQSFAGHALTDVATTGGSAAYFFGLSPLLGFIGGGVLGAGAMDLIGVERERRRDVATGIVLGTALGWRRCSSISTRPRARPRGRPNRSCSVRSSPSILRRSRCVLVVERRRPGASSSRSIARCCSVH